MHSMESSSFFFFFFPGETFRYLSTKKLGIFREVFSYFSANSINFANFFGLNFSSFSILKK
jgi:hypothetical protein